MQTEDTINIPNTDQGNMCRSSDYNKLVMILSNAPKKATITVTGFKYMYEVIYTILKKKIQLAKPAPARR